MASSRDRKAPYACIYVPWLKGLPPMGHNEWLVFAELCKRVYFDGHRNAWASQPRAKMAEELGLTERQVSDAVGRLVAKKVLSVKHPGHNGWATEYYVMPGHPWPRATLKKREK